MKGARSRKFRDLIRRGNPLRRQIDLVVPRVGGKPRKDGKPHEREQFLIDYLRDLCTAFDKALEDVGGVSRIYIVGNGKRRKEMAA